MVGDQFTAFVVDRDAPGFSVGAEEHKLGIKSSSTTTLGLDDCRVARENLIGEVGWGVKIALNVLNVGRLKLGVQSIGSAKEALETTVKIGVKSIRAARDSVQLTTRPQFVMISTKPMIGEKPTLRV